MSEVIVRERYLKNGKKVYEYCFELAHEGGKRRRRTKSGFATKREARAAGRQALYEYENVGEVVVDNNISYSDFLDFWIENDCKNTCKEQTIKGYEKKIKLYIKPELGAYRIKSINKDNLQAFITDLYNDGFSVNTVTSIKGLLTKSFNFAVDRNYIPASPAVNLVIPKNKQPDRPTRFKQHIFLEKDQVDKIFERFPKGTSSFIPLKIAYHTGMRPGEVFGLIWDDIDFVNKTITVNRQVQWYAGKRTEEEKKRTNGTSESNGYWYFCEPKYKSYRTIDIDDTLLDILKKSLGKTSMRKLLIKGGDLQVLQFNTEDMKKVEKVAKKYGILYSVLPDCNRKDGLSEVIFHTEAVPRVNMMIQKLKFGKIATFDDYLKNGDEKSLGKLMDFLKKQQGNEKSHTIEGDRVNSAIDGLIEKVGMFAMEKKAISVDQVKENFSINGEQAESVIRQLETIGVLGKKNEDGTHTVMMDKDAFINRVRGYQDLAERMRAVAASKKGENVYIDSLTYEQFMMLGDAELSRRFSMQDEAEQKAKIDREQANELEYVDESQKSDAAESANASNGSTGAKPVRNPEREKPKWEDTITNRMLHWSYTPEQKEEVKKALAAGVPKATILTYFYPEVSVEKMSSYRKKP